MDTNKLYIKNMVCRRCILTVRRLLEEQGVEALGVELGVVTLAHALDDTQLAALAKRLEEYGFELLGDRKTQLLELLRISIIRFVREKGPDDGKNLSDYLCDTCHRDYSYLSKLFTEMRGTSIEKYYVAQKVEYAKELLFYGELTVGEIADRLGYSSVGHLSNQFKAQTGITPTQFRRLRKDAPLRPLDDI